MAESGGEAHRPGSVDVARLAGVSQKTVSRVMNDEPYVRAELRERVLTAARQLGYRPNAAARSLTSGRSRRLGVVALGGGLYGPGTILADVERTAREFGYSVSVVYTHADDEHGVRDALHRLLQQDVEGIVLTEAIDEGQIDVTLDMPVLSMGRFPGLMAARRIRASEQPDRSGYLATRHLIDLGHTEVRHVAGPMSWWASRDREEGWRSALEEAGLPVVDPLVSDWTVAGGYAAGQRLAEDETATAVFVANDDMAIGVVRALFDHGIEVPARMSVMGMDDAPAAAYLRPSLTTVVQDFTELVAEGIGKLIAAMGTPDAGEEQLQQRDRPLRIRESTAPPTT